MKIGDMLKKEAASQTGAARQPDVVTLTPLRWDGGFHPDTLRGLLNLGRFFQSQGLVLSAENTRGGSQAMARAELLGRVLAKDPKSSAGGRAWFLDSDIVPTIPTALALLAVDADIVTIPYCSRVATEGTSRFWTVRVPLGRPRIRVSNGHRLLGIAGSGLGMTSISRAAIVRMAAHFPELLSWCDSSQRRRGMPCVFNPLIRVRPERVGAEDVGQAFDEEDASFFARALECGLRVEALCDLWVAHAHGERTFTPAPGDTFARAIGLPPPCP